MPQLLSHPSMELALAYYLNGVERRLFTKSLLPTLRESETHSWEQLC